MQGLNFELNKISSSNCFSFRKNPNKINSIEYSIKFNENAIFYRFDTLFHFFILFIILVC